ncbi:hypothetical protein CHLNCDRAFT_51155 [Chlorella variabilis]|uniref:Serine aminopeptidase S33 domain-containing protein n=1 Tax=Chlorella variabilis TaxID=554065 RepID=E1Z9V5_CHLVA|nr:hypothetical protein CHLNCDRAFT_51155 [Chlorella variabilis]EFN57589.1 hypothetical protein CHLNCDRAFT_51155 [Chlorella variabilis]|eukprot:XP_005849691.1 hypothetical protein CHLNCDRAFT_51155 [Chlorella variabilis]
MATAFQELLGLDALPQTGRQARDASRALGDLVLAGVAVSPLLGQLVAEHLSAARAPPPRFVDVSTGKAHSRPHAHPAQPRTAACPQCDATASGPEASALPLTPSPSPHPPPPRPSCLSMPRHHPTPGSPAGLRLRYLEWGSGGEVVLLLHDLGEAADIWAPIGRRLGERGYHAFALDLRGHGESGGSRDGWYSADMLAEDVRAFILAKDLYVAPLAVVGCGMGAAAGLALAQHNPFLAGALLAAEFSLPVAQVRALQARQAGAQAGSAQAGASGNGGGGGSGSGSGGGSSGGGGGGGALSSKQLLPWWGFRAGQAAAFGGVEHCAAFLAHPLASLAPGLLLPLARAAQRALACAGGEAGASVGNSVGAAAVGGDDGTDGGSSSPSARDGPAADPAEEAAQLQHLLAQAQRPLRGAVASACSLLRLPPGLVDGYAGDGDYYGGFEEDDSGGLKPRMDPAFLFSFDPAALLAGLPSLRCHLLLLHGGTAGSWVTPGDAAAMAQAAAAGGAASAAVAAVPGAGHFLASDHPDQLLQQIVGFLEGPAIRCFDRRSLAPAVAAGCRRPEVLGLKPLPQYASVEEAKKALGPRAIPTAAAIEAELVRLRVEEGRAADDASSEEGEAGGHRTALAKEPPDYFGFVG